MHARRCRVRAKPRSSFNARDGHVGRASSVVKLSTQTLMVVPSLCLVTVADERAAQVREVSIGSSAIEPM